MFRLALTSNSGKTKEKRQSRKRQQQKRQTGKKRILHKYKSQTKRLNSLIVANQRPIKLKCVVAPISPISDQYSPECRTVPTQNGEKSRKKPRKSCKTTLIPTSVHKTNKISKNTIPSHRSMTQMRWLAKHILHPPRSTVFNNYS